MKSRYLLLVIFLTMTLVGCSKEYSVTLYNDDGTVYEAYEGVDADSRVELPILEEDNQVFVGWSDGDITYYKDLGVGSDIELTAVFEEADEVFDYDIDPESDEVNLSGYTGDAKYLKIPEEINGSIIRRIAPRAFENSDFIEVQIPKSVFHINHEVFDGSSDLEKISFYGDYIGQVETGIFEEDYDELLVEYAEECIVTEENDDSWSFSEGCPIKSVNEVETFESNNFEWKLYHVTVDLRYYDHLSTGLRIYSKAFSNLESLTTVEFPERYSMFHPGIFYNTPSLVNVTFEDNEDYDVIDNIVYSEDHSELVYYPSGLEYESFQIPDSVNVVRPVAFHDNFNLVTISVPKSVDTIGSNSFYMMHKLESIQVDDDNDYIYTEDGVLYGQNHTLVFYPVAKTDEHFTVPETTTTIAPYAFYGQQFLETISLSSNLEEIGECAFMETEKLRVLDLPSSVTYIGYDLARRSSIETVIINRSLEEDGSLPGPVQHRYPDNPSIYVPDDSYDDYMADSNWQPIGEFLHPMSELEEE
ncbi:MAG: leucine-rich repeat protein [Candidatus Izemoplasmatales bacterium]